MKTTVEISNQLMREVRELAARERTTLRALIEAGLRSVLRERGTGAAFRLRDAAVDGKGLVPELRGAGWDRVRDRAYEGRGG